LDLVDEDPNFAALMDEYRNGVYIFKLQEDEVWNKLNIDSTQIYNYWTENKEDYSFPDRVSFGEIFSMKDSLIKKYYQSLQDGVEFDSLAALYTERQGKKKDKGFYELQDVNFSDLSREANKIRSEGQFAKPVPFSGGYSIFKLYKRDLARLKTFEEARAEVAGLVQEQESKRLADDYINKLVNIYHPVIFYDELQKAFSE
jgi:peptidyl-prolyl cis-trans isomerase SurA